MRALILAAGYGQRFRPQTLKYAKPALPFLNFPIMGFPLFYLEQAGLKELVMNTHYLPETIKLATQTCVENRYPVHFSHEYPHILGSGGGLAQALSFFSHTSRHEPLILANGDTVALYSDTNIIAKLMEFHRRHQASATLLVSDFPQVKENLGGVYISADLDVKMFSKTPVENPLLQAKHFNGFLILQPEIWEDLSLLPSNLLYDVLQKKINSGMKIMAFEDVTAPANFELGNLPDYLQATAKMLALLSLGGPFGQTIEKIFQRFNPLWKEGWRPHFNGARVLSLSPLPADLQVEDFAVIGRNVLIPQNKTISRCVVDHGLDLTLYHNLKETFLVRS